MTVQGLKIKPLSLHWTAWSCFCFFLSASGIRMFTMWKNTSICHLERLKVTLWVVGKQSAITEIICVAAASSPLMSVCPLLLFLHFLLLPSPHLFCFQRATFSLFYSHLLCCRLIWFPPPVSLSSVTLPRPSLHLFFLCQFSFTAALHCYFLTVPVISCLFLTHTHLRFLWRPWSQRECDFQQTSQKMKNGKQLQMKISCKGKCDLHDVTRNNTGHLHEDWKLLHPTRRCLAERCRRRQTWLGSHRASTMAAALCK